MTDVPHPNFDLEEQRVRIWRAIEEGEKFAAEQRKLTNEALKLGRDYRLAVWSFALSAVAAAGSVITVAIVALYAWR
jgi:hypothetical protein